MFGGLIQIYIDYFFAVGWRIFLFFYFTSIPTHCTENPIYVLPEKDLRGLSLNSYIYVPVSDLYIPRIGPHLFGCS